MNKNELLLLADEHFSGFIVDLAEDPEDSKVHSEMGQDITEEYFSFVRMLLRLNGISASHLASATRPAIEPHDPELYSFTLPTIEKDPQAFSKPFCVE